jgi:peptide chain release factor 2
MPNFWANQAKAKSLTRELSEHKNIIETFFKVETEYKDLLEMQEITGKEDAGELEEECGRLKNEIEDLEIKFSLKEKDNKLDAILSIHPGAGGTESCDWASMLLRMYLRWIERKGFQSKILDLEPGDVAGIKNAVVEVKGPYAYGYLKAESGIHRLVRISPFDSNKRRHTSFASCFAYPIISNTAKIEVKESELKFEAFRSSGPGGQNVNKLNTAVRITHIPTGIAVTCQSERSQYQNRVNAMKVLMSKLYILKREEERKRLQNVTKEKTEIGWGREIRSYVFQPYRMVKDHRTGCETGNVEKVMDGDLDSFIRVWLLSTLSSRNEKTTN